MCIIKKKKENNKLFYKKIDCMKKICKVNKKYI